MNNLLLVVAIVLTFSTLLAAKRFFGKIGVIGFMGLATIMANIMICKSVTLLGLGATLGNVMFASNFLATDILTECYGVKYAKKGVMFAMFAAVLFLVCTQLMLLFMPNETDFAQTSMETLFALTPRITIASVSMFVLSNVVDVRLYEYMRVKSNGKLMWLRNNLCTIVCNGCENFLFYFIAFYGVEGMDIQTLLMLGASATIIEIIIALCDTPFLYLAKKIKAND